jgi:energy-coupling factor transport system permease protein
VVPVTLTTLESSFQLAEAMEARGFGAGRRTSYTPMGWSALDRVVVGAAVAGAALFLLRLAAGGGWNPYPVFTAPLPDPLMVLACLLLATPALRSRR